MSKGPFRRLTRVAVVSTTSLVMLVAGAGMSTAYAAPTTATTTQGSSTTSNADHSKGNAGTSGTYDQPQPLSTADQNSGGANGQCPGGPYCSTRDGSASGNGNQTTGQHTGEPCAGCVGKADNKNPQGQMPNGSDHNAGYECDRNKGIGQSNPAHTGCVGQTIAAVIDICSTNAQAPSTGSLLAVEGTSISSTNPLAPTATTSGAHTVDATAPTGYHFVQCPERQSGSTQNITGAGSATEGVTVPSGGSAVAYFYVEKDTTPPPPPVITQNLAGVIYVCGTPMVAPDAGAQLAIEGTSFSTQSAQFPAQPVTAGEHTVDATAPTGYHFVDCGGSQQIVTPTTATETVNVPAGEDETAIFYVAQDTTPPTVTQTLAGNIYLCSSGQLVNGGTLSATGPQTFTGEANPFGPTEVAAGTYSMTATAPTGYELVVCNGKGSTGAESVEVPAGGSGVGNFYVAPVETTPGGGQTLAGVIYLCSSGHVVSGGTLSATGESQTFTDQSNPFGPVSVPAGAYDMSATAPTGYHLVVCNGEGSTGTETVTVPENGSGVGVFYVAPDVTPPTVTQTIAGVIYVCSTGMPVTGGSLSATGPQTLTGEANPFGPTQVPAGDYSMTATAPAGYHLVVCNGQGSTGAETVSVPAGGAGVGRFFVAPDVTPPAITQTLSGVILVCSSGQLVPGGSLSATSADGTTTQANPYGPQMVAPGVYTVTATAPSGYHLVVCNGSGSVGAEQVTVPAGGAGVATFFVAPNAPSTPSVPTEVLGEKIPRTPTGSGTPSTPSVSPTSAGTPSALPYTGSDVSALLPGGLGAMVVGLLLLLAGRRRRTA